MTWTSDVRDFASEVIDSPLASACCHESAHAILDGGGDLLNMARDLQVLRSELMGARRLAHYLGMPDERRALGQFTRRAAELCDRVRMETPDA